MTWFDNYSDNNPCDVKNLNDIDYELEKTIEILHNKNSAYGIKINSIVIEIGKKLPDNLQKYKHSTYIIDNFKFHLEIDFDSNYKIIQIGLTIDYEYSLRYKDMLFGNRSLKDEINKLLQFSYCVKRNGDEYYFPMINIFLWSDQGYTYPGYKYYIYHNHDKHHKHKIGEFIDEDD